MPGAKTKKKSNDKKFGKNVGKVFGGLEDAGKKLMQGTEDIVDTLWQGETDKEKEKNRKMAQEQGKDVMKVVIVVSLSVTVLVGLYLYYKHK
jgi:hypothetical protein